MMILLSLHHFCENILASIAITTRNTDKICNKASFLFTLKPKNIACLLRCVIHLVIAGEESDDAAVSEDEEDTDEDEEINLGELERTLSNDEGMELLIFIYTLKSMPVTVSSCRLWNNHVKDTHVMYHCDP